jgi:hypothetical protein
MSASTKPRAKTSSHPVRNCNRTNGALHANLTYGNFINFETHHTFKAHGKAYRNDKSKSSIKGWSTRTARRVKDAIDGAFASLGTTIMMPAGEVFTFAGLDTDDRGNLNVQVDYANEVGVAVIKKTTEKAK